MAAAATTEAGATADVAAFLPSATPSTAAAAAAAVAEADSSPEYWLRWQFGQCFGDKDASEDYLEADILSAVEFDPTGEFLATGDKGGRIVIFRRTPDSRSPEPEVVCYHYSKLDQLSVADHLRVAGCCWRCAPYCARWIHVLHGVPESRVRV